MARHKYTNEEIEQWRKDNKKIMYANPDDTRIIVPKLSGFGFTFNWANPIGWIVLIVVIAAIITLRFVIARAVKGG